MPKTVALNYPDRTSLLVARVISFSSPFSGPVVIGVEVFVRSFETHWRLIRAAAFDLSVHEELKSAVDLMHREGGVARSDGICSVLLDLRIWKFSDVMIHAQKCSP